MSHNCHNIVTNKRHYGKIIDNIDVRFRACILKRSPISI